MKNRETGSMGNIDADRSDIIKDLRSVEGNVKGVKPEDIKTMIERVSRISDPARVEQIKDDLAGARPEQVMDILKESLDQAGSQESEGVFDDETEERQETAADRARKRASMFY